jgi:hypothetical protein
LSQQGNPADTDRLPPMLDRHVELFTAKHPGKWLPTEVSQ